MAVVQELQYIVFRTRVRRLITVSDTVVEMPMCPWKLVKHSVD